MLYTIDTHSLIWFLTENKKLGKKALKILEETDQGKHIVIIPTIVLAELLYLCENKDVKLDFKDFLNKLKESFNYIPYSLDLNVILKSIELKKLKDIHDRIIVATALSTNTKLITKDKLIKDTGYLDCIW